MEVTLQEILDAREHRAQTQHQLLTEYRKPLLCFTMNIPGPEKYNHDISAAFSVGCWLLQAALADTAVLYRKLSRKETGCEAYYIVDIPPKKLKQIALEIEATEPIGRLFDMDVQDEAGNRITRTALGLPARKCLICDRDAALCARSRNHGLDQIQKKTAELLQLAVNHWYCEYIAVQAYLALTQEVNTTPKPGLVDRNNCGAHKDMTLRHFFASANALRPYFARFVQTGYQTKSQPGKVVLPQIRRIGIEAEAAMLQATHGINTHKGAIFSLGLLCAAAGRLDPKDWRADLLLRQCAQLADGIVEQDLRNITAETAKTAGEKVYAEHGICGVRGLAQAGYPVLQDIALPVFHDCLLQGMSVNKAGAITLLYIIANTDDTNMIFRSDRNTQTQIQNTIKHILDATPYPEFDTIYELDEIFIKQNISPGGSADLLAMTYLLYQLEQAK